MSSSRPQSRALSPARSTEKLRRVCGVIHQLPLSLNREDVLPGTLNDSGVIRAILTEVIRACGKSRIQIAEEMSYLVGREVTERMLNGFTAESREDYRWPAELDRAFCTVTGDTRLLTCRVELHGFHVIDDDDLLLLELGRAVHQKNEAVDAIEVLQRKLAGREL